MNFNQETIDQIELVFGCIGVTLGLFFGVFLLVSKNKYAKANIFLGIYLLIFSVRMGKSLFHDHYSISRSFLVIFLGLLLAVGPSLMQYSIFLRRPYCSPKPYALFWHYLPMVIVILFSPFIPTNHEPYGWIFHLGLFLHGIIYSILTLYYIFNDKELLESHGGPTLKKWLVFLTLATIIMFFNHILIFHNIISYYPNGALTFSILMLLLSFWALGKPFLFTKGKSRYLKSAMEDIKITEYFNKLSILMEDEKLYLDPDLSLTKLSEIIGVGSKQLSQVINQVLHQNYSQYIAAQRVEEAKRLLANENYKNYKISTIAYESGFNNISTFNMAFKKYTHITAIEYRRSLTTQKFGQFKNRVPKS
tara:strand:- start:61962 stop:63050 length:1089 start_codon:yes stop_codon:yes gene_type:complete